MNVTTTMTPPTSLGRVKWGLKDSWVITRRDLDHWVHQPGQIVAGLLFPVVFIILFGFVFGSGMIAPEGGDYIDFLMPGLFAQTMAFGIGETMQAVNNDFSKGITDRFRSMPMAPSAVVVGRNAADMLNSITGLIIMMICGLAIGWRWGGSFGDVLLAMGILLLLRFAFLWIGIYLGLVIKTPEAVGAVWGLLFPVTMLTNAFVDPALMPAWLGTIAEWNPLSATISATRELFDSPEFVEGGSSWVTENAMLMAVVWPLLIVVVTLPLAVRRYQRLSR
jgi:ABC-2 type transport system permease protein